MGVVYKLKQEVIDFIVNQKKDNPELSCRKISDVIREKFQVEVSKSSVNAIIKQSSLSSPVGRRSNSALKVQKFKIPEERKAELFIDKEAVSHLLEEKPLPLLDHKDVAKTIPQIKPEFALEKSEEKDISEILNNKTSSKKEVLSKKIEKPLVEEELPAVIPLPAAELTEIVREELTSSELAPEKLPVSELPVVIPIPLSEENPVLKTELSQIDAVEPVIKAQEPVLTPVSQPEPLVDKPEPIKQESKLPSEKPQLLSDEPAPSVEEEKPHLRLEPLQTMPPVGSSVTSEEKKEIKTPELEVRQEEFIPAIEEPIPPIKEAKKEEPSSSVDEMGPPKVETAKIDEKEVVEPKPVTEIEPLKDKSCLEDKVWVPDTEVFVGPQETKEIFAQIKGPFLDGLGCFFLKAAEWELSNSSVLGGLLRKHSNAYFEVDINELSETLLYLEAFGIQKLEEIKNYSQEGLWTVNDIKQKPSFDVLSKSVESVSSLKSLAIAMANEYAQLFSEISYIKIFFDDKTDICFDAQMKSVWYDSNVQSVFNLPLNKALQYLSTNFISNVQPVIFYNIPGYKSFARQFFDFAAAFENTGEKNITKISIFDGHKEEIAKFTLIPAKKRSFITGAWPWQEECKKFIEDDMRVIQSFHHPILDKKIYYSELKTKLAQMTIGQTMNIRVALLRETGLGWPYLAIVTNIPEPAMPIEDIISTYLSRWPNFQEGYNNFTARTERASYGVVSVAPAHNRVSLLKGEGQYNLLLGTTDFWTCVQFLLSSLNNYCQRHFFPPHYEKLDFSSIKERFYNLSGYITKDKETLLVTLAPQEGYAYHKDLEYAVRRLNESHIKNYAGTRLFIRIKL